jgi:HK97 family phage portal protein
VTILGFWSNLLGRDSVPVAAMSPNVTYLGGGDLADGFNVRDWTVPKLWRTQPHLRTVVSFRARNVAHLGLHAFVREGDDRRRDRTSPLARLLQRPNGEQTMFELIYSLVGDLDLYDRAFWLVVPDAEAPSGFSLRRLPPSWVSASKHNAFGVTEWQVSNEDGDKTIPVSADQMLAFTGYHPTSPLAGSPTIESLRETLHEQVEAAKFRSQVWKRGGRVSAVLQRPKDAPEWSDAAREAFREDWYAKYTGSGSKAGGTPILEDGMTLNRIDFNAQEQQFVEAAKLALSTVASAYHVNPTMVGVLDNANYSNVREFRRMLYGDSLGPSLAQVEDRINTFLLPMLGVDSAQYFVEFNIAEKLQGSFEEQAAVMQTMVGAPIMTRNEGRAKFNLQAIDGGDELVTPLNVLIGGQASATDSGSQNIAPKAALDTQVKSALMGSIKAAATGPQREKVAQVLATFFERQGKAVLSRLGASEDWWDGERWDRELTEDLTKVSHAIAATLGKNEADRLGYPDDFDPDLTVNFLKAVAGRYAAAINATTKAQLAKAIDSEDADPADVFDQAKGSRADGTAAQVANFAAGFALVEAAKQVGRANGRNATKTWITGANPRPEHAALDGQTVGIDEDFSNGAKWPGDDGEPGCNCSVSVDI